MRQLRLRDLGGIVVIDFIDMVLESNRDLVVRRLVECLGRDRTKHQVAELTSLGLLQMTRKRISQGLFEAYTEQCPECGGRGVKVVKEFPTGGKQQQQQPQQQKNGGGNGGGTPSPAQVAKRNAKQEAADAAAAEAADTAAQEPEHAPEPEVAVATAASADGTTAADGVPANGTAPDYEDLTPPEWRFAAAPAD